MMAEAADASLAKVNSRGRPPVAVSWSEEDFGPRLTLTQRLGLSPCLAEARV
jgi:hypothetical protein